MKCVNEICSQNTLYACEKKKIYRIIKINHFGSIKIIRRLAEMGFAEGQKVVVLNKSILGKTLLIGILGYVITLKSDNAELIDVSEVL